jgi:cytochrome c biogenesis factor
MKRTGPGYKDRINAHNAMLAAIILFSVLFLVMLIGMLIPLLKPGAVLDATWFNGRTALPTLVLAMMLGVCLLIPDIAPLRIVGVVMAVILATVIFVVVSPLGNLPIDASTPVLGFAMLAVFHRIYRVCRAGSGATLRSISPHIIHLGIVLILIGVVVSTNTRIDGSEVIREGTLGTYARQPYAVKVTGIGSQYEGAPYGEYPGSSYVTQVDFELYSGGRLIDRDEVKYITDFKWGQSYATNYVYRSLTEEVFITTKWSEGDSANLYMRTAPWITAVWGGIIIMSVGIVLLMYTVRTKRAAPGKVKKDGRGGKKIRNGGDDGDDGSDIDQKYERLLRTELDRMKQARK